MNSVEIFVNEVLAKQEDRDWLLSDPATLEEGKRIADKVKTGELVITDMEAGLLPLAIIAHLTEYALEVNGARGIPREVTIETLRDVNVWLDGYYEQEGVRGFCEYCWLRRHFTGGLFTVGRLQFCLEENYGLVPMFFESKKELLRYIKQLPEKKKTILIAGNPDRQEGSDTGAKKSGKNAVSVVCNLPKDSFLMDFSNNGIYHDMIFKKRLQITYASIPIFLDNIVKNRYNAVVNEGITIQVKKDNKHVWRRKGNEDGRKEEYPDL